MRMAARPASRAFNKWKDEAVKRREAYARLCGAGRLWAHRSAKAFRTWKAASAERSRVRRMLVRAARAFTSPELRAALNAWLEMRAARNHARASMGRCLSHWTQRRVAVRFRHWTAVTGHATAAAAVSVAERRREEALRAQHLARAQQLRELMARPCVKRGRYSGAWRAVDLRLTSTALTYASGRPGNLKMRTVILTWVADVQPLGASRIRMTGAASLLRPLDSCWRWSVSLTPLGRQHCSAKVLAFGSQTQEGMLTWVDELRRAIYTQRIAAGSATTAGTMGDATLMPASPLIWGGTMGGGGMSPLGSATRLPPPRRSPAPLRTTLTPTSHANAMAGGGRLGHAATTGARRPPAPLPVREGAHPSPGRGTARLSSERLPPGLAMPADLHTTTTPPHASSPGKRLAGASRGLHVPQHAALTTVPE